MFYLMRDITEVKDRRLGRLVQFDERSRSYPIRALLEAEPKPRSYTWAMKYQEDQLQTPRCVGFSFSQEISAKPVVDPPALGSALRANAIYERAQELDEWPDVGYDGTSVLAGAAAAAEMGFYLEYRWAFGLDDLVLAVGHHGPAVLGINWYEQMYDPDEVGLVTVGGEAAGGHAILCRGVSVRRRLFILHNSWGADWGVAGTCTITFDDMDRLLHEQGEACVPVKRRHSA